MMKKFLGHIFKKILRNIFADFSNLFDVAQYPSRVEKSINSQKKNINLLEKFHAEIVNKPQHRDWM